MPRIFVTSDQHFDHTNIIKYCNRPFSNTYKMNETLLKNWNDTVDKEDVVYFLGDLAFGTGSRSTDYWLNQLNGKNKLNRQTTLFTKNLFSESSIIIRMLLIPQEFNCLTEFLILHFNHTFD